VAVAELGTKTEKRITTTDTAAALFLRTETHLFISFVTFDIAKYQG
jgi:hypothetical protein